MKNEAGADCLFSAEGRSPTPTSPSTSSLGVTGEILPIIIHLLSPHAISPPSCVALLMQPTADYPAAQVSPCVQATAFLLNRLFHSL